MRLLFCLLLACLGRLYAAPLPLFAADDPHLRYTGRVDFSQPRQPRFWAPGVYVEARFAGPRCEVLLTDERRYGSSHNWVEVVVDGRATRHQLSQVANVLVVADHLGPGPHTLLLCKDTEAEQGYLALTGLRCQRLLPLPPRPAHRIEFAGNSITCGYGVDTSAVACHRGQWYDQHNAYLAYGPRTARALGADWQLTAESGIGLIHSCCNKPNLLPQEFGTVELRVGGQPWDFARYQPDVVTICLGQNDGVQDSVQFCGAYLAFLRTLRGYYPQARLVCLTSPMADARLAAVLRRYLAGVVAAAQVAGDARVSSYFFRARYTSGCDGHPSLAEQGLIAEELTAYLRGLTGW